MQYGMDNRPDSYTHPFGRYKMKLKWWWERHQFDIKRWVQSSQSAEACG